MKTFKLIGASMIGAFLATSAQAHETGLAHGADVLHPGFGIDHLMIVLAAAAVVSIFVWRRR